MNKYGKNHSLTINIDVIPLKISLIRFNTLTPFFGKYLDSSDDAILILSMHARRCFVKVFSNFVNG